MIAVIDYGMGNLASVAKAVQFLGGKPCVTSDPAKVHRAHGVILPGVGAFGEAMKQLKKRRLLPAVMESIYGDKPFLGLCLGMQLLFEASEESPGIKGIGIFGGRVRKLSSGRKLKVPHMGWNQIHHESKAANPLLKGVPDGAFMYFVHSYAVDPQQKGVVAAWTRYGRVFPSILWNAGRIWATQFHPEKSQRWGLKILRNFLKECSC